MTSSYACWSIMFPGFPEGAMTVNGTSFPFGDMVRELIDGSVKGMASAIGDEPMGNWTLNYDAEEELVKISIVKIKFID